jgi:hypothetical protein
MKIRASEYRREDNKVSAFEHGDGWILRCVYGPAYFWDPKAGQWDSRWDVMKGSKSRYEVSFSDMVDLLKTLKPFEPADVTIPSAQG